MARPRMQRLLYAVREEGIMVYLPEESVQQISEAMEAKGASKRKLARETGMTRNVVDKLFYRVGHPIRLNALKKIVSYLEMKVLLKSLNESED